MQHLYAPWREIYFTKKEEGCPFCKCVENEEKDHEFGILFRAKFCFGVMNKYPYSPGHFMIIPYKHEENIENLDEKTWQEMSFFVRIGVKILKDSIKAKGVNIGMNLGNMAGAGIAPHCHYHLVPRYNGDTNFITTIAKTRVCGVDFDKLYEKLLSAFKQNL
ncbi:MULTISPECIES: HIT family protein [unclassified Campylobacter]|uniref:HIT family protein n=1 Tax=unclassified Campylobacter TaxID=2593542 RepID=UPI001237C9C5|nr:MULTISPECIES: HIT domain-containing protein [unclassified Campylobacter]KAA6226436.1 HIT domain-containing protein [Campylobacter sp. LR286c]KAA6226526.1 HIT domain-containing protein [Campylobacter sp. LR185c]KAA6226924.1 HIT domain-containing protein [Campylobacter sp. LR196d]KAA6233668.1 HIT domain-containing protein [Campylobacter sp. LR291e]KAA6233888.1 HIT domain-containing protein [Campylobacter sp. LR264d]